MEGKNKRKVFLLRPGADGVRKVKGGEERVRERERESERERAEEAK